MQSFRQYIFYHHILYLVRITSMMLPLLLLLGHPLQHLIRTYTLCQVVFVVATYVYFTGLKLNLLVLGSSHRWESEAFFFTVGQKRFCFVQSRRAMPANRLENCTS